ncbi:XdhC family protein [Microbacterium esteraromaticum]|uniref:XdhC family protein n=1 Tax=Microbacterium esteraromaticum TaxID=57043 RepID=A0A7D8AIM8_9MICO|nr:XdhC/CoxI family protein [Microbacterium esteraromaticum]QMU96566.1 XdhC family protein [Microbacterium esteraromaticum]
MLDRIHDYRECLAEPARWAIATIVEVSGSVPRPAGTSMAVRDDGRTIGSVSGGCVEGAVVDAALTCLENGEAALHSFGYADDDGMSVGLMCGGDVRVLVQPLSQIAVAVGERLTRIAEPGTVLLRDLPLDDASPLPADAIVAVVDAVVDADDPLPDATAAAGSSAEAVSADPLTAGGLRLDPQAAGSIAAAARAGGVRVVEIRDRGDQECPIVRRMLVESSSAPARLIIYGANDFSAALAQAAAVLGLHVTVCDARPVFATRDRHPGAHEVVLQHPAEHFAHELRAGRVDSRTAVVLLTHDPRFDLPVLDRALRLELTYVGAMGSRITHEKRAQELRAGGLPAERLARLHSPIGLDLGARTPAEVAVSILAELILVESTRRAGLETTIRSAQPPRLRDTGGDVHDDRRICASTPALASASALAPALAPAPPSAPASASAEAGELAWT